MKKVILGIVVFATISFVGCKNSAKENTASTNQTAQNNEKSITFGVRGNCAMCKKTIENAANSIDGVAYATWDVDKKKIDVTFDTTKTNQMAIHNAIAASGYDTNKVNSDSNSYENLPGCCQYDHKMLMKQ